MAEIIMPKMGDAMTEGKVVRWYKKAGDAVKKGEPVLEIETDKVNLDLEAEQDGTLGDVAAEEGKMVEVGGVLATILGAGEKAQPKKETAAPPAEEPPARRAIDKKDSIKKSTGDYAEAIDMKAPRVDRTSAPASSAATATDDNGRRRSSPLARRMARELGVSIENVQGSGPGGRIIANDIKNFKPAPSAPQKAKTPALPPLQKLETKEIPLTAMPI